MLKLIVRFPSTVPSCHTALSPATTSLPARISKHTITLNTMSTTTCELKSILWSENMTFRYNSTNLCDYPIGAGLWIHFAPRGVGDSSKQGLQTDGISGEE